MGGFELHRATNDDFEALNALRLEAMRPSLEQLGRFDPPRSRERFRASFSAEHTRHIVVGGERVGFFALKPHLDGLLLDHLYLAAHAHGRGLGSAVLQSILAQADRSQARMFVGALRGSDANRFYARHGFVLTREDEFDLYYERCAP